MSPSQLPNAGDEATVVRDTQVYRQPDEATVSGSLHKGAVVQVGVGPFMGRIAYTLIQGGGTASGWVARNALEVRKR